MSTTAPIPAIPAVPPQPASTETPYDRVQYVAASFPRMSPSRIAAVGYLFGLRPPTASKCRYLELGCGQGYTLLSLAQLYPESEFHGIDLSARHIENAKRLAEKAGLNNVRFEHRSISDITKDKDGVYDYITSHGVYSWVPAEVKESHFEICGTQLSERGMAYISYNTLPGWAHLRVIREMLIYHTQRYQEPLEKFNQAKILVGFLRETAPGGQDGWLAKWLSSVEMLLARSDPSYFLHEYLEDTNDPCFFHQFMERAEAHGLQYVSEAHVAAIFPANLGPQASKVVEMLKRSVVDGEQYMDFARNTQFRTTLLCHKDIELNRNIDFSCLRQLLYSTGVKPVNVTRNLDPNVAEEFIFGNGSKFTSKDPLAKAGLHFLADHPGRFLSIPAMYDGALEVMRKQNFSHPPAEQPNAINTLFTLVGRFIVAGVTEISTPDMGVFLPCDTLPEKPFTVPVARVQGEEKVPILRGDLRSEKASDAAAVLLAFCDGSRDKEQLFEIYRKQVADGVIMPPVPKSFDSAPDLRASFNEILQEFTRGGMMWKERPVVVEDSESKS